MSILESIKAIAQNGSLDGLIAVSLVDIILKQKAALDRYESMSGKHGTAGKVNAEVAAILESVQLNG